MPQNIQQNRIVSEQKYSSDFNHYNSKLQENNENRNFENNNIQKMKRDNNGHT
jgi:predicted class III extradiol MEMO1 family dioxygenase